MITSSALSLQPSWLSPAMMIGCVVDEPVCGFEDGVGLLPILDGAVHCFKGDC